MADELQTIHYPFPHVRRLHARLRFDVEPVSTNKRKPIVRNGKPAIIQTARAEAHNEHLRWLLKLQHNRPPLDCPIALAVTVVFERPKSYPAGPRIWHTNTPDLDNITKGVQDALKAVWVDDRKVAQVANLKVWGATGETAHYEIDIYELQPIPQHTHFWIPDYENDASKCSECGLMDKTVKPPRRNDHVHMYLRIGDMKTATCSCGKTVEPKRPWKQAIADAVRCCADANKTPQQQAQALMQYLAEADDIEELTKDQIAVAIKYVNDHLADMTFAFRCTGCDKPVSTFKCKACGGEANDKMTLGKAVVTDLDLERWAASRLMAPSVPKPTKCGRCGRLWMDENSEFCVCGVAK